MDHHKIEKNLNHEIDLRQKIENTSNYQLAIGVVSDIL